MGLVTPTSSMLFFISSFFVCISTVLSALISVVASAFMMRVSILICLVMGFGISGVGAVSADENPFPAISFRVMNDFATANFSSRISLATILMVLFTLTDNPDLLNLHTRQKNPDHKGEQKTHASGWMKSLACG